MVHVERDLQALRELFEMDENVKEDEFIGGSMSRESADEIDSDFEGENSRKVEAALFIAGRFLSLQELVTLTDVNPILLRKVLGDLEDKYNSSGIEIVRQEGKWKMDVASDYKDIVNKLAMGQSEFTKAEQETLAIIAYKQPMKQSVLIKIRGNKGYDHVKRFVEMGLVSKKRIGHTAELSLSDSFYDYFHLENKKDSSVHSTLFEGKVEGLGEAEERGNLKEEGKGVG